MRKFLVLVVLSLISCNNDISNNELDKNLSNSLIEYNATGNKDVLLKSYSDLKNNNDFRKNGLQREFFISATNVLMNLEKFNELEKLIKNNHDIDDYTREKMINELNFYRFKNKDKEKAKLYLKNNVNLIKSKIKSNPKDTLLYFEYFTLQTLLIGRDKTISEIDSLMPKNSSYRERFKGMIDDYISDPKSGANWQNTKYNK